MNRTPVTRIVLLTVGAALLGSACSSKPKPVAASEAKPAAPSATPVPVRTPVPVAEPKLETPPRVSVDELNRKGYLKDTFFDFDRYEIRSDQRDTLTKDAAWLRENAAVKVTVEGHSDERGTSQYNMALGERRASAVRDYLVQLGISSARIQIISYGKERPFVTGHDEKSWAQNRRGHFLVTAN